jgi:hypothetical protein
MNNRRVYARAMLLSVCLVAPFATAELSLSHSLSTPRKPQQKDAPVTQHATGPFEAKIMPLEPAVKTEDNSLARMALDKQFHGDLEATSKGEMLAAATPVKGSAGYVAIERVSGSLHGRTGTFVLEHSATMNRGTSQLNIVVVPDSGTGQLTGISGTMTIVIVNGKHSYDLAYTLPAS